jgi:CRISPR-associated endonuclease/helicase Cas3
MHATLPKSRRDELVAAGLQVFPTETDRAELDDWKAKEEADRYLLEPVENFDVAFNKAVEAYQIGLRVLWVMNTVDRCLPISHKLENHKEQHCQNTCLVLGRRKGFCRVASLG